MGVSRMTETEAFFDFFKEEQEKQKKLARMEVGQCRTIADLQRIAKARGYANGWVWQMAKIKHISR